MHSTCDAIQTEEQSLILVSNVSLKKAVELLQVVHQDGAQPGQPSSPCHGRTQSQGGAGGAAQQTTRKIAACIMGLLPRWHFSK